MADPSVRRFEFVPTPAVLSARSRGSFIPCPVCEADNERYLFHKMGVRFVRCRSCNLVYANPPVAADRQYFDADASGQFKRPRDRDLFQAELTSIVELVAKDFEQRHARPPRHILIAGRTLGGQVPPGVRSVEVVPLGADDVDRLATHGDVSTIVRHITSSTDIVLLNEMLEACPQSTTVMRQLAAALPIEADVAVVFSNAGSYPARLLQRHWPRFFAWKSVYFDVDNLTKLMAGTGFRPVAHHRRATPYTLLYVAERLTSERPAAPYLERAHLGSATVRLPAGTSVAVFESSRQDRTSDLLSIIVPVYNEATYVRPVLEALREKQLSIPKEIIVVESNSTDGTRQIVQSFDGTPGMQILLEDEPRGKGAAVRRGLSAAKGTIILIQDADFEYDLDDYDALLEPLLQRRTNFVLGSRSLGLDDWKVRRYASSKVKAFLMNLAQVMFAKTFNLLFQERTTDINTMFKVFRRECVEDINFRGNGFNFDIELVCSIVGKGFSPMEVPVNYVARGFDEGKKINFVTEFWPSYSMLFRCRFRRHRRG